MDQQNAPAVQSPHIVQAAPVPQELCSKCHMPVSPTDKFCPHCGNQIVRSVSVAKQIWIYLISILFPPFGLSWTFKYFRSQHRQVMWVGIIAGVLTIASAVITTWWTLSIFQTVNQQVNQEFKGLQYLGY